MIEIGEKTAEEFLQAQVGRIANVLFEQQAQNGMYEGFSENYVKVMMESDADISGEIIKVRLTKAADGFLYAERAE
mgnify:CR=1 FL=1